MGYDIVGSLGYGTDEVGADVDANSCPVSVAGSAVTASLAAGASLAGTISVTRQIRPDRFVLNRVIAASLNFTALTVGTVALIASQGGEVDGDVFAPDAVGTALRATVSATPSLPINFTLRNKSAVAVTNISVSVIGPSLSAA
jgi:hypothetical protein